MPVPARSGADLSHPLGDERYRLVRELGRGAFGVVFLAEDLVSHQQVALKTLSGYSRAGLAQLKSEFRGFASVLHPNLVELLHLHASDEHGFFSMEYVDGCSLRDWVAPQDRLDVTRLRRALRELASGIQAIHLDGKLHRDIKPSNASWPHHL